MGIHTAIQAMLYVVRKSIRAHGYNRNRQGIRVIQSPDCLCGLISCHMGHPYVHKDDIIIALW